VRGCVAQAGLGSVDPAGLGSVDHAGLGSVDQAGLGNVDPGELSNVGQGEQGVVPQAVAGGGLAVWGVALWQCSRDGLAGSRPLEEGRQLLPHYPSDGYRQRNHVNKIH
jgi:hypothetical protein